MSAGVGRRHARRLVALVLIAGLYWSARLPGVTPQERAALAARFGFATLALPEVAGHPRRTVRAVHPSLERISAWISSVGASVALGDLDGDGLSNDLCHVDPRTDTVVIAPAPGTPQRYDAFALDPAPLPYDRATMAPMGCVTGDLNEDGLVDVLVYHWGRTPIAFLRSRQASSQLDYVAAEVVQPFARWYTNAATLADVDGDGHTDVVIGNYFQDGARILDAAASGQESMQASMSRARNSGRHHLLLFASATGDPPSVRFTEVDGALDPDLSLGWTLAVGAADLDGDLLPELYFANDFGPDQLLHNRSSPGTPRFAALLGTKGLTEPTSKVLGRDSFKGMGVDFGDLNDDGRLDIYVSNIAAEYALEESHFTYLSSGSVEQMHRGVAPYVDRSEPLGLSRGGWGWDAKLADFDNDGVLEALQATGFVKGEINRWPELHELAMGNDGLLSNPALWLRVQPGDDLSGRQHNPFYVRGQSGRYVDVAAELGLDEPQVTRGLGIADVNGDGLLDFVAANQWAPSHLYLNRSSGAGSFLGLHVLRSVAGVAGREVSTHAGHPVAADLGRPAIGAVVTVRPPGGRTLVSPVDGGNGHSGRRPPDVHFGLGPVPASSRIQVDVEWRGLGGRARRQSFDLPPGWHTVMLGSE